MVADSELRGNAARAGAGGGLHSFFDSLYALDRLTVTENVLDLAEVSRKGLAGGPEDCGHGGAGIFCQWPSRGVPVIIADSMFSNNNIKDTLKKDIVGTHDLFFVPLW